MSSLAIGNIFPSMKEARLSITAALKDEGLSYYTVASKTTVLILACKLSKGQTQEGIAKCEFKLRCITSKSKSKGPITSITQLQHHTCPPSIHYKFEGNSQVRYLMQHHTKSVSINRLITVAQIRANEQEKSGNVISYLAAYRTKQAILEKLDGREEDEFSKMTSLWQRMLKVDPELCISTGCDNDHRFDHFFCLPSATQKAFKYMRPFIAVDACHCTSRYKQTLHIAVGIDGDGNILPLAWGIYQGENVHNWRRFLTDLREALFPNYPTLPQITPHQSHHMVFMSDRQKGLRKALKEIFPMASQAYCCQHIAANVQSRYGIAARKAFWPIVYARTEGEFEKALAELRLVNQHAAIYIRKIKAKYFASYAFPAPRYGYLTSNIAESLNGAWKELRHLTPLRMLVAIWQKVMQTFADRRQRIITSQLLPNVQKAFDNRLITSRRYTAMNSSPTVYLIISQQGKEHIVDLRNRTCTCMQFQEYGSPCSHGLVAARAAQVDPMTLVLDYLKPKAWTKIYKSSWSHLSPFLTTDLEADDTLPPLMKRRQGRPKAKRIRKPVALQDRQNRCSNPWCRQKGHNKRACQTVETPDGVIEDRGQEDTGDSSNERGSGSYSDGVKETAKARLERLSSAREKRVKAKRRKQRALERGEKVKRGRKRKDYIETDQSSSLSSVPVTSKTNSPLSLSESEIDTREGSISKNSSIIRLDTDIANAISRGITPEVVRAKRVKEALDMIAKEEQLARAETERRNDPFRSLSPSLNPIQAVILPQRTRKRQRDQDTEQDRIVIEDIVLGEQDNIVLRQSQRSLTVKKRR